MNIEQLPSNVLVKIFANICDRKLLRQVSKNFKNVIDSYSKLMQKYVLNVQKMKDEDKMQSLYQHLKFEKLNFNEFKSIDLFTEQQQNKVKEIFVKRKGDIKEAVWFLQSTIAIFNNIQTLFLDISSESRPNGLLSKIKIKLLPNELSKLESLTIRSDIELTNVMFMFADIKTIKKLTLHLALNVEYDHHEFPTDAAWKLEELNMNIPAFNDEFARCCKKFLESQKSTLKVLRHNFSEKMCNFIMHNLPDLKLLHLRIRCDKNFCDELKPNEKLKSLSLNSFPDDDEKTLEKILHHYRNIKFLNVQPNGESEFDEWYDESLEPKNVELLNLTHLSLHVLVGSFLDGVKMPNLKCLEIDMDLYEDFRYFDKIEFNAENLANVEKLSISGVSKKNITAIIEKCPKLQHLNLTGIRGYDSNSENSDSEDECDCCDERPLGLKTLFKKAPQLKIVGTLENKKWQEEVEAAFAKLNRKVTIKDYDKFEDMMYDYWPLDMIGDFDYYVSKFIEYKCLNN